MLSRRSDLYTDNNKNKENDLGIVENELDEIIALGPLGLGLNGVKPGHIDEMLRDKYRHFAD